MQAILAIFRGDAPLADAPQQAIDTTTSIPETGSSPSTPTAPTATTTAAPDTSAATPSVTGPEQEVPGIVPPDEEC
jgi:hypothetical protein